MNIQYRGGNTDGISGIDDTDWFDGYDTYSLFGNWQTAGDLVGKGYKWSDLTPEEKTKFVSNPDNNVFLSDNGEFIQVRYRVRVVKGLKGNVWRIKENVVPAIEGIVGQYLSPKGQHTNIYSDFSKGNSSYQTGYFSPMVYGISKSTKYTNI